MTTSTSPRSSQQSSTLTNLLKRARYYLAKGNPEPYWATSPKDISTPEESLKVLLNVENVVDDWRASDGGLTHAACDTRWYISWARSQLKEIEGIKSKSELARIIAAYEAAMYDELDQPYATCYIGEIYSCIIATGLYLLLKKAKEDFDIYPSKSGKIAVNMNHGEHCFNSRNPWYRDLQAVIEDKIFIHAWTHHDGAEQTTLYSVSIKGQSRDVPKKNIIGTLREKIIKAGYKHILN